MKCNKTLEQSVHNEPDFEEYDESMMPKNQKHEIKQLEIHNKPNLEEKEVINLGNEEEVKGTRISIHLKAEQN